jgi:hypothetical protein
MTASRDISTKKSSAVSMPDSHNLNKRADGPVRVRFNSNPVLTYPQMNRTRLPDAIPADNKGNRDSAE